MRILVLSGPGVRLDRPGVEDPAPGTPEALASRCRRWGAEVAADVACEWVDHSRALCAVLAETAADGAVVVPGDVGFDDDALAAAVAATDALVVGVHVGDLRRRAGDPSGTAVGRHCVRVIHGRGVDGYRAGVHHLGWRRAWPSDTLAYGPGRDQLGDLRMPRGDGPHPVAVLLHGGFWSDPWERDQTDGLAVDLARHGWATWNVEYRRVGSGGGWPMTADDVATAVDHIAMVAGEHALDLANVAVVGHSAGGHLALLAGGRRSARVRPARVVAMAPITDLALAAVQRIGAGAVERFVADAQIRAASPVDRLPVGVPVLLAHAEDDALVPVEQSVGFADAARAAGDDVDFVEAAEGGHLQWVDPASAAWAVVREALS